MLDKIRIKHIVEAVLFAAAEPLPIDRLREIFDEEERLTVDGMRDILVELAQDYGQRAVMLQELASGFCFQVRSDWATWVQRLWEEKPTRYSRATLETLAIIAYRQPITRAEVEAIRGVAVSTQIIKTLTEREWVRVVGHRDVLGKPALYATTKQFLDYFNLKSLEELPTLMQLRDWEETPEGTPQQLSLTIASPTLAEMVEEIEESIDSDTREPEEEERYVHVDLDHEESTDEEIDAIEIRKEVEEERYVYTDLDHEESIEEEIEHMEQLEEEVEEN